MSGSRLVAALIACAIALAGVTAGAQAGDPVGAAAKHHKRHKKPKKQHKKKKPKPVVTPAPASGTTVAVDAVAGGAFHLVFTATRATGAAPNAATGTFTGTLAPTGDEIGHFAGPVTCLEVEGNEIGLFYPIAESNPPGLEALNAGVFISVTVDGQGHATMAGFLPVPQAEADACPPGMAPALMPAEGSGTITG